jgi:drug/metabolite transporter (DMT)-like permease
MIRTGGRRAALVFALIAVAAWSSAFVAIGLALRELPVSALVPLRFWPSSLCFGVLAAIGFIRLPRPRDIPGVVALGLTGQVIYQYALCAAQTAMSAGSAAVFAGLIPAMSALIAIPVLGERLSARGWLGIAIAFAGVAIANLVGDGASFHPIALLALVASSASACFFVFQKPFLERYTAMELTAYGVWTGAAVTIGYAPQVVHVVEHASLHSLLLAVYLGLVPTALGYTLWSAALARAPAGSVSTMLYLESPIVFALAWLLLGEHPTWATIAGASPVVSGVALAASGVRRSRQPSTMVIVGD